MDRFDYSRLSLIHQELEIYRRILYAYSEYITRQVVLSVPGRADIGAARAYIQFDKMMVAEHAKLGIGRNRRLLGNADHIV